MKKKYQFIVVGLTLFLSAAAPGVVELLPDFKNKFLVQVISAVLPGIFAVLDYLSTHVPQLKKAKTTFLCICWR